MCCELCVHLRAAPLHLDRFMLVIARGKRGEGERNKRGNVLLLSFGHVGELGLESPQSDPSVRDLP